MLKHFESMLEERQEEVVQSRGGAGKMQVFAHTSS